MSGKTGMKRYAVETKLEAMRLFYEEGKTRAQITALLEIRDPEAVKKWLKRYRREGVAGFCKPIGRKRKQPKSQQAELERLRMENDLLKKFHTELRNEVLAKRNIGLWLTIKKNTQ
jgi:transposase-like protein